MYGAYGYGGYGAIASMASVGLLLGFLAFVGAIVVTVLFYKKFIAVDNIYKNPGLKRDWGPFFRFEHLIIENILKVLYIFTSSLIAFEILAAIITSLFGIAYDPGATFLGIIGFLILCVVLEVINRLWFEFSLLTVLIWKNTSAIRKSVVEDVDVSGNQPAGTAQQNVSGSTQAYHGVPSGTEAAQPTQPYVAPAAPVQQPAVSAHYPAAEQPMQPTVSPQSATATTPVPPAAPQAPASTATPWTCPSCGAFNKSGAFCAQCGSKRNN